MDIFNRPPAISEDTLQYELYPPPQSADKASVTSLAALVDALVAALLPAHIWHRDAFELKVVPDRHARDPKFAGAKPEAEPGTETGERWMLEGRMRVGDSVDDEWCVVWLLREASLRWDVAVTVFDSDGEFLLIEAADSLPSWVTPTNAENRVWIYRSKLHIIPLSYLSPPSTRSHSRRALGGDESDEGENFGDDEGWLNVPDALKVLRSDSNTEALKSVQDSVWKRISGYPDAARQHIHVAKAFLPIDIAKSLFQEPSLVQRATEAFYTRDAIQLRAAHRMSRFPPQPSALTPVRMTRTAYAQLTGQKFHPPKIFGQFKERESTPEWRWRDIGMKIACGFEMLYQESKSRAEGTSIDAQRVSADARKDALKRNPEYIDYIKSLVSTGYFRNELEGSKLWAELEDKAAEVFIGSRREDDASRPSFAGLVNTAIAQAGETPTLPDLEEDSDDWLNVDAENFDEKLAETMRSRPEKPKNKEGNEGEAMDVDQPAKEGKDDEESRVAQAQADKLQGLAKKIEKFVEGEGTLEGAVFDDEEMSEDDDEQLSDFSDEEFPSDSEEGAARVVDVDEEEAGAKAARQAAMDRLVPALDPTEYGKMPPEFYANSQTVAPVTMETDAVDEAAPSALVTTSSAVPSNPTELSVASRPIRRPILPRDDFDGVDSDDETDEEEDGLGDADGDDGDESDEDRPQVVGDIEIDMGAEQDEFLEFSRTALGISDEMWGDILRERKDRGAFVPEGLATKKSRPKETIEVPPFANSSAGSGPRLRAPQAGPRPNVNPNLDSFDAVMEAMESELAKAREAKRPFAPAKPSTAQPASEPKPAGQSASGKAKGKGKVPADEDDDTDADVDAELDDAQLEAAMEAELRGALEREEGDSGDEEPMDYGMMRNFLESFKSQAGLAGPVGALAGRLEPAWTLPRDES
ncbi:SGT1-domain-containing protein [Phellopilus nigrolimitatus]|nr:SGT1-domain-containing protein [Phellopilus nigrolimitatus]